MAIIVPQIKITADSISSYNVYVDKNSKRGKNPISLNNLVKGKPKGDITKQQRKRIIELTNNMHLANNCDKLKTHIANKHKLRPLTFITLTLSDVQKHSDYFIKKNMLQLFIKNMQNRNFLKQYIWRAESQKSGNIHFHIITTGFIDKVIIQNNWNLILDKNGYMEKRKAYKFDINAPSTKIEASRSINSTSGYLAKYIGKNEDTRKIEGRIWGCSDNLRDINTFTELNSFDITETINQGLKTGEIEAFHMEHCSVFTGNILKFLNTNNAKLFERFMINTKDNSSKIMGTYIKPIHNTENIMDFVASVPISKAQIKAENRRKTMNDLKYQLKIF